MPKAVDERLSINGFKWSFQRGHTGDSVIVAFHLHLCAQGNGRVGHLSVPVELPVVLWVVLLSHIQQQGVAGQAVPVAYISGKGLENALGFPFAAGQHILQKHAVGFGWLDRYPV